MRPIRDYNPCSQTYTLAVPDEEVRQDLATLLTGVAVAMSPTESHL